jgi:hypothetical protein
MTATNKRLLISESRGDSNRCTPYRGNPINTTHTLLTPVHVRPTYASCGRPSYVATFREASTDLDRSYCSREKGLPTQSAARRLIDPRVRTELLSWASQWSRGRRSSSWWWSTTRFTGPISPACDRYVQYLLMGANRTVLNRHRRGYNLGVAALPHTHSSTFSTSCPHFLLMVSPGLHFNQVLTTKSKCWVWRTYGRQVIFRPLDHLS